jgi:hypothetical protein
LDPAVPRSEAGSGVWLTTSKTPGPKPSRLSQFLDWFAGVGKQEHVTFRKWIGAEAVELVFDELRREVEEGHRQLDALRERVTRMFALSGVLLVVIAAFGTSLDTWWAALLFIPAVLVAVAFGLVWREDQRSRTSGSLGHQLLTDAKSSATSSHAVRKGMLPVFTETIEKNGDLRRRRRRVLTRAENLLALAMIQVVVCVLVASPLVD